MQCTDNPTEGSNLLISGPSSDTTRLPSLKSWTRVILKKKFAKFETVKVRKTLNFFTETSIGTVTGLIQWENT